MDVGWTRVAVVDKRLFGFLSLNQTDYVGPANLDHESRSFSESVPNEIFLLYYCKVQRAHIAHPRNPTATSSLKECAPGLGPDVGP